MQRLDEIVIVGVCASGKSTLANRLRQDGYRARTVAQEHSCIPTLWQQSGASVTIYLHASFQAVKQRRDSFMHTRNYEAQLYRLRMARHCATLRIDTSSLTADEVYEIVKAQMEQPRPRCPVPDEPGSDIPSKDDESAQNGDTGPQLPVPDEL